MRKKTAVIVISFLAAAALACGTVALVNTSRLRRTEYRLRANSERAFSELVSGMIELSETLEKSVYISDPALQSALCTQVYGCAGKAQMSMSAIPYSSNEIEKAAEFLSKVGDYAFVLSKEINRESGYEEEQWQNLAALSDTAAVLASNLQSLQGQLSDGSLILDELSATGGREDVPLLSDSIASMENEFPELPTLIYDGPFSDGIERGNPRLLQTLSSVDEKTAQGTAAQFLRVEENALESAGECGGNVPCWCFRAAMSGGEYRISVTKQGGVIYSVLSSRTVGEGDYKIEDALEIAASVLAQAGIENMQESYYILQNGVLTVNFEYVQDGVICYPDLVKIGICMDNGSLQSYDASGYINAHTGREWPSETIAVEEVELPEQLTVESSQLALIPLDGGDEMLCYEFLCRSKADRRCLIYVNAQTGAQERILLLIEDENGSLTV